MSGSGAVLPVLPVISIGQVYFASNLQMKLKWEVSEEHCVLQVSTLNKSRRDGGRAQACSESSVGYTHRCQASPIPSVLGTLAGQL